MGRVSAEHGFQVLIWGNGKLWYNWYRKVMVELKEVVEGVTHAQSTQKSGICQADPPMLDVQNRSNLEFH